MNESTNRMPVPNRDGTATHSKHKSIRREKLIQAPVNLHRDAPDRLKYNSLEIFKHSFTRCNDDQLDSNSTDKYEVSLLRGQ